MPSERLLLLSLLLLAWLALGWTSWRLRRALRRARLAQESQDRFQKIYETTPDAMGITRASDGLYLDVNASFLTVTGYARSEVLGRTSVQLGIWHPPEQRAQLLALYRRDGKVDSLEMQIRRKDGTLIDGLMSVRGLRVDRQDALLFIYRDISERERLRREAQQAQAERAAAEAANQAKTEFLSRMSHELRTPLNAVLGFAQLLLLTPGAALNARQRGQVESIAQAGWHLLDLINDVLDISRIEAGRLQVQTRAVALVPLLDEALGLLQPQLQQMSLRLEADYRGLKLPEVCVDPVRLRQAIVNLLSNAIKYNREGGWLRVLAQPSAGGLELRIEDGGQGMSAEQMAHLYEPFNRLGRERSAVDGTGIGLVLTRHLLELMGARLTISSVEGEGTTARLWLPLASEANGTPVAPQPAAGGTSA